MELNHKKNLQINQFKMLFNQNNKDNLNINNITLLKVLGNHLFFRCFIKSENLLIIFEIDQNFTPKYIQHTKYQYKTSQIYLGPLIWEQYDQIYFL